MTLPAVSRLAVAPGAWRYAAPCFLLAIGLVPIAFPIALAAVGLGVGVLWFHRDPDKRPPESGIVSPADGRVSVRREETDAEGRPRVRVGVFMNVTDVHVNRAPAAGTVRSVTHRPGAYKPAFSKASERNERVVVDCGDYEVALIAGWFARRIHPYVTAGESIDRGQRIGHVSFGSRADVLLPPEYDLDDVLVDDGQRVVAGQTRFV
ncbi:MAG: protein sorting system archaetidylserine decarboxylase [Halobacteriota archaeon]